MKKKVKKRVCSKGFEGRVPVKNKIKRGVGDDCCGGDGNGGDRWYTFR